MAEKINIDLIVNTANSANSIKEIKNSITELKTAASELTEATQKFGEGTNDFKKGAKEIELVTKKADELKQKLLNMEIVIDVANSAESIKDIKDSIKELNKEANKLEKGSESFNLFTAKAEELKGKLKNIDLNIDTANASKSVKEIRESIKNLNSLASEFGEDSVEFDRVTKAAGKLKERLDDVNEAVNANKGGTAFENFGSQIGVLGNKLAGLDFEGANKSIATLGTQLKSVSFADIKDGVKGMISTLGNLGKAILSNPIFLITAIVVGVGVALFALKDKVKVISDAFDAVGAIINKTIQYFKDLSDKILGTGFAAEDAANRTIEASKKQLLTGQNLFDTQIRLAKASGKETTQLELDKQKFIENTSKKELEALNKKRNFNGKLSVEDQKLFDEAVARKEEARISIIEIENKDATDKLTKQKANNEKIALANEQLRQKIKQAEVDAVFDKNERDKKQIELENKNEIKKINDSLGNQALKDEALLQQKLVFENKLAILKAKIETEAKEMAKALADANQKIKEKEEADAIKTAEKKKKDNEDELNGKLKLAEEKAKLNELDLQAQLDVLAIKKEIELNAVVIDSADLQKSVDTKKAIETKYIDDVAKTKKEYAEKDRLANLANIDGGLDTAKQGLNGLASLNDAYAEIKSANLKEGSKEAEAFAEKQFKIHKALQMAGVIIDGAKAAVASMASAPLAIGIVPNPVGIASLIGVATTTAASIAKIASTQYKSSNVSGGSTPKVPTIPSGGDTKEKTEPARLNDFSLFGAGGKTGTTPTANQAPVRAVVVESDITSVQRKINYFKTSSEI